MEKELFTLLRLGLNNTRIDNEDCGDIIHFSVQQWKELVAFAFKQGVGAIAFDGFVSILEKDLTSIINSSELKLLKLHWSANCFILEEKNKTQIKRMIELNYIWMKAGCRMLLMKGQANGLYYPNPFHRAIGDIDCYLFNDYDYGNRVAASVGAEIDTNWYKHSKIRYKGEIFENHQYFVTTRGGRRYRLLNKTLCELINEEVFVKYPNSNVLLPPVMFNALFLTYHGFSHFLSEGMRLKQLIDWAMFLKAEQHNLDWGKFYRLCEEFKFSRYLHAMNDIAVRYLGVEITNKDIIVDSLYSEKIMNSVLYDDEYIFNSGKGVWKNRFHLISNMIRYRWKYNQIYQESILKQFYYYIIGYLFHTEK